MRVINGSLFAAALLLAYYLGLADAATLTWVGFIGATLQYSVSLRTAKQAAIEPAVGAAPEIEFWSGGLPANCAAASTGTLLARGNLPSDWLAAAATGAVAKTGTWTFNGLADGTIGYFRINRAGSPSECDMQGDVTVTAGGGAMTVDNTDIAPAQVVTVTGFTLTAGNA